MIVRPAGIILPTVLMALLVLELLTVGTLTLAVQQSALARDRALATRAQLAARSAAARAPARWEDGRYQQLHLGERVTLTSNYAPDTRTFMTVERIAADLFSLHVTSAVYRGTELAGQASAFLLIGAVDTDAIAAAFPAALAARGSLRLSGATEVDGTGSAVECAAHTPRPGIAVVRAEDVMSAPGVNVQGTPPVQATPALADPAQLARLGATPLTSIALAADRIETGAIALAPQQTAGRCEQAAAGNWGAPLDGMHACAAYYPLIYAPADLAVISGAGQGTLVVEGDLTLNGEVQFFGPVFVRGRLLAGNNAQIEGALLVDGSERSSQLHGARISYNGCAIRRALTQSPAFNRPIFRRGRSWLPSF